MIHFIGAEMWANLKAQSCPIPVEDGPEPSTTTTFARERIIIEYDDDGDSFGPPHTNMRNPRIRMIRNIGAKITIYAQEPRLGAQPWEHKTRAEHILDLVLVALEKAIKVRKNGWQITSAKFINPADLDGSETPGGAVYELKFSVERGVYEQKWDGTARPQTAITPTTIVNTTEVTIRDDPAPAETGCGG